MKKPAIFLALTVFTFLVVISNTRADDLNLIFVSPTPANNSIKSTTYFTANISSNGTVTSCNITLDGTNYTMTVASGNLSASRNNTGLSSGLHIYNVTCDGFQSATRREWIAFGNCTSCSECNSMISASDQYTTINLVSNTTYATTGFEICLYNLKTGMTFDGNGNTIRQGASNGYAVYNDNPSDCNGITIKNAKWFGRGLYYGGFTFGCGGGGRVAGSLKIINNEFNQVYHSLGIQGGTCFTTYFNMSYNNFSNTSYVYIFDGQESACMTYDTISYNIFNDTYVELQGFQGNNGYGIKNNIFSSAINGTGTAIKLGRITYEVYNTDINNNTFIGKNLTFLHETTTGTVRIFDNKFLNNTNLFSGPDAPTTIKWNTTRNCGQTSIIGGCLGGNYYTQYTGKDYGSDGIGDSALYLVAGSMNDFLPLTNTTASLSVTFVSPTPANNTIKSSGSFTANVSLNGTIYYNLCVITLDGTNYTMTTASGNLSASRVNSGLSSGLHTYNVTCEGYQSETRHVWVSFGNCTSCAECQSMIDGSDANVQVNLANNVSGTPCVTLNKALYFNGNGNTITSGLSTEPNVYITASYVNLSDIKLTGANYCIKWGSYSFFDRVWNIDCLGNAGAINMFSGICRDGLIFENSTIRGGSGGYTYIFEMGGEYCEGRPGLIFRNLLIESVSGTGMCIEAGGAVQNKQITWDNVTVRNCSYSFADNGGFMNYIIKNSYIYSPFSVGSASYFNLFYNNYFNASISAGSNNRWNTTRALSTNIIGGAYTGGNYYGSAYTGKDRNGDGIGDIPYIIASGSTDYLPLTNENESLNISFVDPTPANASFELTSFTVNVSSNGTLYYPCVTTLDGINYSMTTASGNLSASRVFSSISDGLHTYNVTCDTYFTTETRTVITDSNPPTITFVSKSPVDIDTTNLFGFSANVTYNITDMFGLNTSTIMMYYKTNSTLADCFILINGTTQICGFQTDAIKYNVSDDWYFRMYDNQVYPAIYNINESYMENTPHLRYDFTSHSSYVKIRFLNVSSIKQYSMFEVMANNSGSATATAIYYCNSSYVTGDPDLSTNCVKFYDLLGNVPYNHTHSIYSSHMLIPFAINNVTGLVNGLVLATPTSYFLLRGNTTQWHAYYINSNSSSSEVTTDNGATWTDVGGTFDSHLHQYSGTDSLWYYIAACDQNGFCTDSEMRQDLLQTSGLPPTAPDIMSPLNLSYRGNIAINYTESLSPNNFSIVLYNISLFNPDNTFNKTIVNNNYPNLSYIFNSLTVQDASYRISITDCDSLSQCSISLSDIFTIDNTAPTITVTSPVNTTYHTTTIDLNVSTNEVASWSYSLDGSANASFSPNTSIVATEGPHTIVVYISDDAGNINSTAVSFTVELFSFSASERVVYSLGEKGIVLDQYTMINTTVFVAGIGSVNYSVPFASSTVNFSSILVVNSSGAQIAYTFQTPNISFVAVESEKPYYITYSVLLINTITPTCPLGYSEYSSYCRKIETYTDRTKQYYYFKINVNGEIVVEYNQTLRFVKSSLWDFANSYDYISTADGSTSGLTLEESANNVDLFIINSDDSLESGEHSVGLIYSLPRSVAPPSGGATATCGDGVCTYPESKSTCQADCGNITFSVSSTGTMMPSFAGGNTVCSDSLDGCIVEIFNNNMVPLTVHITLKQYQNDPSYLWYKLDNDTITIQPNNKGSVKITGLVPKDATLGDHRALLAFSASPDQVTLNLDTTVMAQAPETLGMMQIFSKDIQVGKFAFPVWTIVGLIVVAFISAAALVMKSNGKVKRKY